MKIKGAISFLVSTDRTVIEIHDKDANVMFCQIQLTPDQLSQILSRQAQTPVEIELNCVDKLGKKHECKFYEFEIGDTSKQDEKELFLKGILSLKEGNMEDWTPDKYFRSQNSFFKKDGKNFARSVIRRWV